MSLGFTILSLLFPLAASAAADCRPFLRDTLGLVAADAERLTGDASKAPLLDALVRVHGVLKPDQAARVAEALVRRPTLTDDDRALIRANSYYRDELSSLGEDDQLNYLLILPVLQDRLVDFDIAVLASTLGQVPRAARVEFRDQVGDVQSDQSAVHLAEVLRRDEYRTALLDLLLRAVPLEAVVKNVKLMQAAFFPVELRVEFDEVTARAVIEQIRQRRLNLLSALFVPMMIEAVTMEMIAFGRARAGLGPPAPGIELTEPAKVRAYAHHFISTRMKSRSPVGVVMALIGTFGNFEPVPMPATEVIARFRAGARRVLNR